MSLPLALRIDRGRRNFPHRKLLRKRSLRFRLETTFSREMQNLPIGHRGISCGKIFVRISRPRLSAHVCNTPTLNLSTSGFSAHASSAVINTSRVLAGSIIESIHNLAAPYRGSAWASYVALISSYSAFRFASSTTSPDRSICLARTSPRVLAADAPLITAYRAVGHANRNRGLNALPHIA